MIKITVFLLSFILVLNATDWVEAQTFELKKDESKTVLVKMLNNEKLLEFRWTLYKNELLTTHRFYDDFPYQTVLSKKHPNDSILIKVANTGSRFKQAPMLLIKFVDFDYKTKKAKFRMMIYDSKEEIVLDFLKGDT